MCKPMPRDWHDRHAVNTIEDQDKRDFYRSIVADKKPYFMRYIYPDLMRQYNKYITNTNKSALREFQMTVDEMRALPESKLTDRQLDFLRYYRTRMPVGVGDCVMNKICRRFEEEFDGYIGKRFNGGSNKFDYSIMKSGIEYSYTQMREIQRLYDEYQRRIQNYTMYAYYQRIDAGERKATTDGMFQEMCRDCEAVCQNRQILCEIVLDICYKKSSSKGFAWCMCADEIVRNLLANTGNTISAPVRDDDGDIEYCGKRYKVISKTKEEYEEETYEHYSE